MRDEISSDQERETQCCDDLDMYRAGMVGIPNKICHGRGGEKEEDRVHECSFNRNVKEKENVYCDRGGYFK